VHGVAVATVTIQAVL